MPDSNLSLYLTSYDEQHVFGNETRELGLAESHTCNAVIGFNTQWDFVGAD
jgi:hypothetical protein